MIQVVSKIAEIEELNNFFSLRDKYGMPVWDVIRYDVIKHIQYRYNPNKETVPHTSVGNRLKIFVRCFTPFLRLLFKGKRRVLFYAHSRHQNKNGLYYDRQAIDLINMVAPGDRFIFDSSHAGSCEYEAYEAPQAFFYAWYRFKKVLNKKTLLDPSVTKRICDVINEGFSEFVINETTVISLYEHFVALCEMYDWILCIIKPERVIVSYGRYKAISFAARKKNIPSFLIQHSLIDKADATIGGTCPQKENGINPDTLLTYGSYWGEYLKHLMDVKVLGNRFLYKETGKVTDDGTVLFVSSLYQGPYLSQLLLDIAPRHTNVKFIYKLHPGEKGLREHYEKMFESVPNVCVQLNEESMASILQRCTLVVLISSTTLFEALNTGKCVAIYDVPDFADVTSFLKSAPNTYCFTEKSQLEEILLTHKYIKKDGLSYYDDFNVETANYVLAM